MILEYGWRLGISPDDANALLEEGEAWAKANGDPRALAAIYNAFAIPCAFSLGEIERARDLSLEGLRLAQEVGDEPLAFALELRVYFTTEPLGNVPATRRAMEAAARHSPEVMGAAETMVGYDTRVAAVGFQGWAKYYDGTLIEALEDLRRGIAIGRERGATEVVGWLISVEAAVLGALGESALAPARESWDIAEQIDSDISRVVSALYLSSVLLDEGDVGAAIGILEQVLPVAAGSAKHSEPELLSIYANALLATGELAAAREAASGALELAQKRGLRRCELLARMALVGVALSDAASTDFSEVSAELERVRTTTEDLGQGLLLPKICELHARLAERNGDAEGRAAALREAQQHFERMGATKAAERIAEGLR